MKSHKAAINRLQSQGRGNDSRLLHISDAELSGLNNLALAHGTQLTTNPNTGLPEAGVLDWIIPIAGLAAIALTYGAAAPAVAAAEATAAPAVLTSGLGALGTTAAADTALTTGLTAAGTAAAPAAASIAPLSTASIGADAALMAPGATGVSSIASGSAAPIVFGAENAAAGAAAADTVPGVGTVAGTYGPDMAMGAEPTTLMQDLGSYGSDAISWAAKNPTPVIMGASYLSSAFGGGGKKKGDDYDPRAHPVKSYGVGDRNIDRLNPIQLGYQPGISPEHTFFRPRFADGGGVQGDAPAVSEMTDAFSGVGDMLPLVLRILGSKKPGAINRNAGMFTPPEQRQVTRGFEKGGEVSGSQRPQGSYGYSNPEGGSIGRGGMRNPRDVFSMLMTPGRDPGSDNWQPPGFNQNQPPGPPTQAWPAPDLSAWVPNIDPSRAAFTPQQTPNWREQVPGGYMPQTGAPPVGMPQIPMMQQATAMPRDIMPQMAPQGGLSGLGQLDPGNRFGFSRGNDMMGRMRGKFKGRGMAMGGDVEGDDAGMEQQGRQLMAATAQVIQSGDKSQNAFDVLNAFIQMFGHDALTDLVGKLRGGSQAKRGAVPGNGDGQGDTVPAVIDGNEPAALSSGEHVIDAHTVAMAGNGNTGAGQEWFENLKRNIRQQKTGADSIPPPLDEGSLPI